MHINHNIKSENYDERKGNIPVSILVLHYTALNFEGSVEVLCNTDTKNRVSSHYLLRKDGQVFELVDTANRAWHAGSGCWKGITDVNSASVGIEIEQLGYNDEGIMEPYTEEQMVSLIELSQILIAKFNISSTCVVGHSDIAPGRKLDPGALDWKRLAKEGVGFWLENYGADLTFPEIKFGDHSDHVRQLQQDLSDYGYELSLDGIYGKETFNVIKGFQRHFYPEKIDGVSNNHMRTILKKMNETKPAV